MADLQCRLQETVNANRETLNNRVEDRRIKEQVTQSRQQQPGTAQAQEGARQSPTTTPQTARAQRKPPASPDVNDQAKTDQQTRLKQADQRRGVARLPRLRSELGVRRLDGVELDSIFITYNTTPSFNAGGGLLYYEAGPSALAGVEIAVLSAVNGELTRFKPFGLSALSEPSESRVPGEVGAVEAYVAGFADTSITSNTVTFTQQGTLGMDFPVVLDDTLVLTFLRQRWVRYRAVYQVTTTFQGNPISQYNADLFAIPAFAGDVLVVKVNLQTGSVQHQAQAFQSHSIANVRDAALATVSGSSRWVFHYDTNETLENLSQIVAEQSGLDSAFGECAGDLFTTPLSARYVHQSDTVSSGSGRLGLPSQVTAARANVDNGGVLIHSAVLLMSDPDRRYRNSSWLAQPRWVGLSTSQGVRVLAAAGTSAADYIEASEYSLDLGDCGQVGWLDDYWGGSFAGVNDELAEPSEVFAQDQITLPSDGPVGTPVIEPINAEAPSEPYEATVVKNIPYINRTALAEQLGGQIAWVVYQAL